MNRLAAFKLTEAYSEYPLLDPMLQPFKGLASRPDRSALPEGGWAKWGGFRQDQTIWQVRNGSVRLTSAALISGGSFRGAADVRLNGTNYVVAAAATGGKIRVFVSTDGAATFSEVTNDGATAADDKYGETRLVDNSVFLEYGVIHDKYSSRDLLVIQNGSDSPRIWDPLASDGAAANSCKVAIHRSVALPEALGQFRVRWGFYDEIEVNNTGCVPTASSVRMTAANSGSYPDMFVRVAILNTVNSGDYIELNPAASLLFDGKAKQIALLIDCADRDILADLKVVIHNGGSSKTIHDGSSSSSIYPYVEEPFDRKENKRFWAWDITELGWSIVTDIWIYFVGSAAPAATVNLDILGAWATGCISPGSKENSAEFGVSLYHSGSRAESPGLVLRNDFDVLLKHEGGTSLDGAVIPQRQGLFYYPTITFVMPSQTEINLGTDYLRIYLRDADGIRHYLVGSIQIAAYAAGVWAAAGSFTVSTKEATQAFNPTISALATWRNEKCELPHALHRPIPIGLSMLAANGRFFVAGKQDNSTAFSLLWISQRENPTRFRLIPDAADDFSATYHTFEGQDICKLVAQPGNSMGNSSIFAVTDQKTILLNGFGASLSHPTVVAQIGSRSPQSFAMNRHEWYFLDDTLRLRVVGSFEDLSRYSMDDKFQAIPAARRAFVSAAVHLDRVYIGYTIAAGSTNSRAMIYNCEFRSFEADDPLPTGGGLTAEQFLVAWDGTDKRRKLLAFGSDCHVYEYEKPGVTTDVGNASGVVVEIGSRKIHFGMTTYLQMRRLRVVMGSHATATLSVVRTFDPGAGTGTSTLSLAPKGSETEVSRWDGAVTASGDQVGYSVMVDLTGTVPGGKLLKGIYAEIMKVDRIGDS